MNKHTGPSVSYSVHEGKHFVSGVSALFLMLINCGAGMVVHLLLLKFSMSRLINDKPQVPLLMSISQLTDKYTFTTSK